MSESPYSMVRLHWRYKPKVVEDKLYFKKWGRVSEATNRYLNLLLSTNSGFETGVVVTGNAGEHAMTTKLADIMCYSPGYSVEPYHFVYLFDVFGHKAEKIAYPDAEAAGIEIFQIETLNPHIHEEKGREHIKNMLLGSLGTIYKSPLCNDYVRSKILGELKDVLDTWEKPPEVTVMPPIGGIDADRFMNVLERKSETLVRYEETRR
jgi:mannosyl-3-phosphoglycerate synthase